ncbi:MAG: hypothetical protein AAGG06_16435 [Pseudomonadota bacterium]
MPDIGFPAQPRAFNLARVIRDVRSQVDNTQIEAVTGRLTDPAAALGGRIADLVGIEKRLTDLNEYSEIIALSEGRAGTTQTVLQTLEDTAVETASASVVALQSGLVGGLEIFGSTARGALDTVIAALNTSFGSRMLFAGDTPDQVPMASPEDILAEVTAIMAAQPTAGAAYAAVQNDFNAAGGVYETAIYGGGTGDAPATEIAPGERVDYGVRADEQAIRDLLRNLAVATVANDPASGFNADERRDLTERAADGMRSAAAGLTGLIATVGTAQQRIGDVKARNLGEEAALTISYNDLAARDQFEAAAELSSLEGQLEGLFLTTSRLSQLSLANFIR